MLESVIECGEGKIEQHNEGKLVLKEIIHDVRRWIIPADEFVEWKQRAEIEVELLSKLAVDLMHVSTELLQHVLQAIEDGIEGRLTSGEIGAHEFFEGRSVAILFTPELRHLPKASLNSRTLGVPVPGGQFRGQFRTRTLYPRR